MHLKNQRPIFVPDQFRDEIEKLSKAALMDMTWGFSMEHVTQPDQGGELTMDEFRKRRDIILMHRKHAQAKS